MLSALLSRPDGAADGGRRRDGSGAPDHSVAESASAPPHSTAAAAAAVTRPCRRASPTPPPAARRSSHEPTIASDPLAGRAGSLHPDCGTYCEAAADFKLTPTAQRGDLFRASAGGGGQADATRGPIFPSSFPPSLLPSLCPCLLPSLLSYFPPFLPPSHPSFLPPSLPPIFLPILPCVPLSPASLLPSAPSLPSFLPPTSPLLHHPQPLPTHPSFLEKNDTNLHSVSLVFALVLGDRESCIKIFI